MVRLLLTTQPAVGYFWVESKAYSDAQAV
jgi:hypothetical protein